jgi:hypothetical protein
MSGVIAAASVAIGASAYKVGTGIKQKNDAKELLKDIEDPNYQTPSYIKDNLATAQRRSAEGISAAEENAFLDNTATAETSLINSYRSRKGSMAGAAVAGENRRKSNRDLLVLDAKARQDNELQLMKQRQIMGDYADKEFQINTLDKFGRELNYARSLEGAGMNNINNGIEDMASTGLSLAGSYSSGKTANPAG